MLVSEMAFHISYTGYSITQPASPSNLNPVNECQTHIWFVVSTHLKNISQSGSSPQVGVKIKNVWNHHLDDFNPIYPPVF